MIEKTQEYFEIKSETIVQYVDNKWSWLGLASLDAKAWKVHWEVNLLLLRWYICFYIAGTLARKKNN